MARLYGSLNNRFDEGKIFGADKIEAGMDVTMYYYSDRHVYRVTRVVDQKHIFAKEYHVCADFETAGGMGHQNWKLFQDVNEYVNYLIAHGREKADAIYHSHNEEEWIFRYNKWQRIERWTLEKYNAESENRKWFINMSAAELAKLNAGKTVIRYRNLDGKVSFNVSDYHYDWEF